MVSVATGVLSSVLGKLPALVERQCNNSFKGVNEEILTMKPELQSMNALLLKLADMDDLDIQVKEWRNQIRELSYDIEDCIDDFIHQMDGGSSRVHKGFFQKSIHKLRTLGARNEIADQILKLKARVAMQVSGKRGITSMVPSQVLLMWYPLTLGCQHFLRRQMP